MIDNFLLCFCVFLVFVCGIQGCIIITLCGEVDSLKAQMNAKKEYEK